MKTKEIHVRVPEMIASAWKQYCEDEKKKGFNKSQSVVFSNLPEIKQYTGHAYQFIHKETRGRKRKDDRTTNQN